MIHRVTSQRYRAGWAALPLLLALFLQAMAPLPDARTWAERYVANWITKEGWRGYTVDEGALVATRRTAAATTGYRPGPIQNVRYVAPRQQLPRSAFGDARWNPLTDRIEGPDGRPWEPFALPTLWYFTGTLRQVTGGTQASWQSACNAAVDGDIVELASDVVMASAFSYPNRGTAGYVLCRGQGFAVAQGTRVAPSDFTSAFALTSNVHTGSVTSAHRMAQGASGWYFRGLKIANGFTSSTLTGSTLMFWGAPTQTSTAHMPSKLVMEQCYLTSPWVPDSVECVRGLTMNGEYMQVRQSYIDGYAGNGLETQAILAVNGLGKALVWDNFLEASTENIMCGGSSTNMGSNTYCADMIWRQNYLFKRLDWMNVPSTVATRKNFFEIKNGARQVFEGNVCENFDGQGQQFDVVINNKPQNSAEQAWLAADDFWLRYNLFDAGFGPFNYGAAASDSGFRRNPGCQRVQTSHNLSINTRAVGNGSNRVQIVGIQQGRTCPNIAIEFNTYGVTNSMLTFANKSTANSNTCPGLIYNNNIGYNRVSYASPRSDDQTGTTVLNTVAGAGNWQCGGNVAYSTASGFSWPGGPYTSANYKATTPILFADSAAGDYTLADSRYLNVSTVGGAPGVNMTQLTTFTSGVR
jgi:hypothetical protein